MRLNVEVPSEEYEAFRRLCQENGVSLSDAVRHLLIGELGREFFLRHGVVGWSPAESQGGTDAHH
jgi:hypothetical protein